MILQEAEFLEVNLKKISKANSTNSNHVAASEKPTDGEASMPTNQEDNSTHKAWGDLLLSRLSENRKLSGEAKKSETDIIKAFFEEYFNAVWGETTGALLFAFGDLLLNDIQKLGFDRNTNPILAFISQKYVSENLIATKHLNMSTYRAIHNAIAKKLIAHSEFKSKRNYNIIYCRSFYNHRPADMLEYLRLQATILKLNSDNYSIEIQKKNRQVFLLLPSNKGSTVAEKVKIQLATELKRLPHTLDPQAKLNKLDVVEAILKHMNINVDKDTSENPPVATESDINKLAQELLDKPAEQMALMQYLLMKTGVEDIKAFLSRDIFSSVKARDLIPASSRIRERVKGINITKNSIKALIAALSKEGAPA